MALALANRVALAFLALVLLGTAGLVLYMANRNGFLARASRSWPTVDGVITASGVREAWVRQGRVGLMNYAPEVRYSYTVDGRAYESSRIGFSDEWLGAPGARDRAAEQASRWPVGAAVRVAYDPDSPDESALLPGGDIPFTAYSASVVGALMLLGAIGCLYFVFRRD